MTIVVCEQSICGFHDEASGMCRASQIELSQHSGGPVCDTIEYDEDAIDFSDWDW